MAMTMTALANSKKVVTELRVEWLIMNRPSRVWPRQGLVAQILSTDDDQDGDDDEQDDDDQDDDSIESNV